MSEPPPNLARRRFLRAAAALAGGSPLAAAGSAGYISKVEINWLKTERIEVPIRNLPAAFDGYRVVQLSDLHIEEENSQENARRAVKRALKLAPDLVVITGDYVTGWINQPAILDILSPLSAPDGVFTIMGNHDHWTNVSTVRAIVEELGISELQNSNARITRDDEALWLAGVDDIWEQQHNLDAALDGIPIDSAVVLLAHEPDFADEAGADGRVSLQLSGHSHGGQVRLPGGYAPILPYLGQKYPYGLRRAGEMFVYTNRGVGYVAPAVRFNCRPEITEITLRQV